MKQSIGVLSLEQRFVGSLVFGSKVFAQLSLRVSKGSAQEGFLACLNSLVFTSPSFNSTVLECSSERETEEPGSSDVSDLVHVVQMHRGFLFSLTT